jgi:basic membrane protein A
VGAIAALVGKSKKVGFVGGMNFPLIHKFEMGYAAGVKQVCPTAKCSCNTLVSRPKRSQSRHGKGARAQPVSAGRQRHLPRVRLHGTRRLRGRASDGKLAIGVDADQYNEAPGFVLTSMVKGVDNAVFDAIKRVKEKRFKGGIYQYGLAEDGVGYVYDVNNEKLIPADVRARVEALKKEIIAGRIVVPSPRP